MVQYKKLGVIALILSFVASLGVNVNNYTNDEGIVIDEGYLPYACAKETINDMYCYKLSKVGSTGVNRNCYYDRERSRKYKVCSTGWELIQVGKEPVACPEPEEPTVCPEPEKPISCPAPIVCPEPTVCPKLSGGGGGGCPPPPVCNTDGTTVCSETIGFIVGDRGKYYCRNCGIGGCDECISNEDIMFDLDFEPVD